MTIRRLVLVSLHLSMVLASTVYADAPLPAQKSYVEYSGNKMFVVDASVEDNITTVREIRPGGVRTEIWKFSGWFRAVQISNDGKVISIPYWGLNLLHVEYRKTEVMLQLIKEGKLVRVVRLNELVQNFDSLKPTLCHFAWGDYIGFNDKDEYVIETEEGGRFFISPDSAPIRRESIPKMLPRGNAKEKDDVENAASQQR